MPQFLNSLEVFAQDKVKENVADAVFNYNPLLAYIMVTNQTILTDMGPLYHCPIEVLEIPDGTWIQGLEPVAGITADTTRTATFQIPELAHALDFSRRDLIHSQKTRNLGTYVGSVVRSALKKQRQQLASVLVTGTLGNQQFDGIDVAVASSGTYGGLDKVVFPNLQSYVDSTTSATSIAFIISQLSQVGRYGVMPDLWLTTPTLYNSIVVIMENKKNLYSVTKEIDTEYGKIGFSGILVNGTTVVLADSAVPANRAYQLTMANWELIFASGGDFVVGQPLQSYNQPGGQRIFVITDPLLVCDNPKMNAKATALTS